MQRRLEGLSVAILATDGFEQSELLEPRKALDDAGADTWIVSPKDDRIRGWNHGDWGETVQVDLPLDRADAARFDALVLPGGVMNPDRLRIDPRAVDFVRAFHDAGKPIAAICHGPWTLIEAGVVQDRRLTSWPSLETDLRNAGAEWTDAPVVRDGLLVTSRKPDDLPQFNRAIVETFAEARVQSRSAAWRHSRH
jgi:protease I